MVNQHTSVCVCVCVYTHQPGGTELVSLLATVTTHQTEWDPFAALLEWSNRNGSITSNRNREGKAETWSEKQAGWSGQAADIRVREETVRVGVTSRVSEDRGTRQG